MKCYLYKFPHALGFHFLCRTFAIFPTLLGGDKYEVGLHMHGSCIFAFSPIFWGVTIFFSSAMHDQFFPTFGNGVDIVGNTIPEYTISILWCYI